VCRDRGEELKLPNFLIIGAAKGGTSSLYRYLEQHPRVFMSTPKEPTFFGHEGESGLYCGPHDEDRAFHSRVITNLSDYQALFEGVTTQTAIGEASVYSLYLPHAASQIKKHLPHATMFAVLRNPVERAYSAYIHVVGQARERRSFADALAQEPERIRKKWNPLWHFKTMGFYYQQVKRYYDTFGRQQVHVFLHEDFRNEPLAFIQRIFEMLGIDKSFVPDMSRRYNVADVPVFPSVEKSLYAVKWRILGLQPRLPKTIRWRLTPVVNTIDRIRTRNRKAPPPIPEDVRASLMTDYRDDILRLQDLLNRDLSHWMTKAS
jgi:Sulfotransferase family